MILVAFAATKEKKVIMNIMNKKLRSLFLGACLCATLFGCGNADTPGGTVAKQQSSAVKELESDIAASAKPAPVSSYEELKNGVNKFAFALYDALPEDSNCFYSPYSIASALSMLDQGAGSDTKTELESVLGIKNLSDWNNEMQGYLNKEWSEQTFVNTANSIWMSNPQEWAANISDDFLLPAKTYYHGEIYEADFTNQADQVVKDVNNWVAEHTNQMIPSIVDKLPPSTVMMLINAVYFEGKWQAPFLEDDTYDDTFHGTSGDSIVPMMHLYDERFSYIDTGSIKGITLPYEDSSVVMKIFIPSKEGDTISALFDALSNDEKQALIDSLDTAENEEIQMVQLPKFTDEQGIDGLDDILKGLGIQSAYASADFSKITDDISVSSVSHKAKIIVDENGTKAAAVTDIMIAETAAMPSEETYFIVDQPFVYVIEDLDIGMLLFVGRENDL